MSDELQFGARLRLERIRTGHTVNSLAEAVGVSRNTITNWQNRTSAPTLDHLAKLSTLGFDVGFVLTGNYVPRAATDLARITPEIEELTRRLRPLLVQFHDFVAAVLPPEPTAAPALSADAIGKCQIGARLREERRRLRMSTEAFADACSIGRNTLMDWQAGKSSPPADRMAALALVGVDVLYVITGNRTPKEAPASQGDA